jgi:hypothetical protein
MRKSTTLALLPGSGKPSKASLPKVKEQDGPSELTIQNILNYSKALRVSKPIKGKEFIEYIAN